MISFKKGFKLLIFIFSIWISGHLIFTIVDGIKDEKNVADVIVVLGNKVNEDGSLSKRLQMRLECALNLIQKGRAKKIIVSGALGKEGFYEGCKMKDFLLENGINDSLIIVDNFGYNTIATVNNASFIVDSLNIKNIIVVSQYYHITRTKMLFKNCGYISVTGASPNYFEVRDIYSLFREFVAFYFELWTECKK